VTAIAFRGVERATDFQFLAFRGLSTALAMVLLFAAGLAISGRDLTMAVISGGFAMGVGLPFFNLGHRSVPAARIPVLRGRVAHASDTSERSATTGRRCDLTSSV